MALTDYDKQHLSTADQAKITAATNAWNTANAAGDKAGMAAAAAQAAAVRNGAGYRTDASGNYTGSYPQNTQASTPKTSQPVQVGSGGNAGNGFTGSMSATDPYGNKITVQYQNGKLVSNVPDGTVMHTAGGDFTYYKDKTETDTMVDELKVINNNQTGAYAQAAAQQKAANDAAVQKAVNDLEAQKTDTNQSYAQMLRQLYINKMNGQKNMDQQLAAQGITGGAAETTRLGYDTSYAEALRQGEQERIGAISDLDKAITDTRLTGDVENARTAAEAVINGANSYSQVLQSLISRNDALEAQKISEANTQKNLAHSLVLQMLSQGDTPSDALLEAADISKADAQTILGRTGKTTYTDEQVYVALQAARNGKTDDAVRAIIEGHYGLPMETVLATGIGTAETTYSDNVVATALAVAQKGQANETVRKIIESYYGLPMETVLVAYSN